MIKQLLTESAAVRHSKLKTLATNTYFPVCILVSYVKQTQLLKYCIALLSIVQKNEEYRITVIRTCSSQK